MGIHAVVDQLFWKYHNDFVYMELWDSHRQVHIELNADVCTVLVHHMDDEFPIPYNARVTTDSCNILGNSQGTHIEFATDDHEAMGNKLSDMFSSRHSVHVRVYMQLNTLDNIHTYIDVMPDAFATILNHSYDRLFTSSQGGWSSADVPINISNKDICNLLVMLDDPIVQNKPYVLCLESNVIQSAQLDVI